MRKNKIMVSINLSLLALVLTIPSIFADYSYNTDQNEATIAYDSLNRVTQKQTEDKQFNYSYDGENWGTLSNISSDNLTIRYDYDDRKRITKETLIIDGISFSREFGYDSSGKILTQEINGNDIDYYYNKQGKLRKIPNFLPSVTYTAFGAVKNKSYYNGLNSVLSYNPQNLRLSTISTSSIQNLAYTYDNAGNIISMLDSVGIKNYSMGYDALNRLINTTINTDLYQYDYDSIGNIRRIASGNSSKRLIYKGSIPHAPSQVIDTTAGAGIYNEKDTGSDSKTRVFEFYLLKELLSNITSVNWSFNTGNGNINSNIPINLTSSVLVLVETNYSSGGAYNANISTAEDQNLFINKFGADAGDVNFLMQNASIGYFEFDLESDIADTIVNASWNCSLGIGSTISFNFTNSTMVLFAYNYTTQGEKTVSCSINSNDGRGNSSNDYKIRGLEIENVTLVRINEKQKTVSFNLVNYFSSLTAAWNMGGDGSAYSASVDLNTSQRATISREVNFSNDGNVEITLTATSCNLFTDYTLDLILNALEIENYNREQRDNSTIRIIVYDIVNQWSQNLTIGFNGTDPIFLNGTTLEENKSIMVIIEGNYTDNGRQEPLLKAFSGNFLSSFIDRFEVWIVELMNLNILKESQNSTIAELITTSYSGNKSISWRYESGEENITSTVPTAVNESQQIMVLIETNYSQAKVFFVNASVNSTSYQNSEQGVVKG